MTDEQALHTTQIGHVVGRVAIRRALADLPPHFGAGHPSVEPVAHVICRLGGHIPNIDNELAGSCPYHRKQAALGLLLAGLIDRPAGDEQ